MANGPIAKINEADTNPSTKSEPPCGLNRSFSFLPSFSKPSSILNQVPIKAPNNNEKITTNIAPPSGRAWVSVGSQ